MRRNFFCWTIAIVAYAQEAPTVGVVPTGGPLRVELEQRVAIGRTGAPVRGRMVEAVYVFDRVAIPAGTAVEGHVAEISAVPTRRRVQALLSGNFSPRREVRAQFDTLVLANGSRLPLRTQAAPGIAHTARIATPRKAADGGKGVKAIAVRAFQTPGKMAQLKSFALGMLPYQRYSWSPGTLFTSALLEPLRGSPAAPVEPLAQASAAEDEIHARLLQPIDSRTARRGEPVVAVVTRPLFSAGALLIPEGTRLQGEIVDAKASRSFHRNGKLLFVFRQLQPPGGAPRDIQGYLEGADTDFNAHMALDAEGAMQVNSPKSRFIFPAIAAAVAGLSVHQDYNAQGVPDQDIVGRAESGAVGLGLIGTVLAQTSKTVASSIAFTGAGFSIYTTFLARGEDLRLPVNTPIRVSVKARPGTVRR